jgi:hypothetical protein
LYLFTSHNFFSFLKIKRLPFLFSAAFQVLPQSLYSFYPGDTWPACMSARASGMAQVRAGSSQLMLLRFLQGSLITGVLLNVFNNDFGTIPA